MYIHLFFLPMLAGATFLLPFALRFLIVNLPLLERSLTRKPEVRARARFVPPSFCCHEKMGKRRMGNSVILVRSEFFVHHHDAHADRKMPPPPQKNKQK